MVDDLLAELQPMKSNLTRLDQNEEELTGEVSSIWDRVKDMEGAAKGSMREAEMSMLKDMERELQNLQVMCFVKETCTIIHSTL